MKALRVLLLIIHVKKSVQAAVTETLMRTNGTLDALYNNGAYAIPGLVQDIPREAYRAIFEVNLFGLL